MQLSQKQRELIENAQIINFQSWQTAYQSDVIHLFQVANTERRFLSDEDWRLLQSMVPSCTNVMTVANMLRDDSNIIVNAAKEQILQTFPNITQPGGDLYPPIRSESCWRDLWNFLRCISYGVAGQIPDYTCPQGLSYLQMLYQELDVPLDAMLVGLKSLKADSLKRIEAAQQDVVAPCFDHLIAKLELFESPK